MANILQTYIEKQTATLKWYSIISELVQATKS